MQRRRALLERERRMRRRREEAEMGLEGESPEERRWMAAGPAVDRGKEVVGWIDRLASPPDYLRSMDATQPSSSPHHHILLLVSQLILLFK
jgi:hypothetical protein